MLLVRFRNPDVLTEKDYFLSDAFHSENDAKLNSFRIDLLEICENGGGRGCKKNSDGSYNIFLTLYFKPQSYFYLGLIISSAILAGCLGYLGYAGIRAWKRKNK